MMPIESDLNMYCSVCTKLAGSNVVECETCLRYNNSCRLLIQNFTTDSEQGAQDRVEKHLSVHEMSLEQTMIFVRHLRALAAGATVVYQNKLIKTRIADPASLNKRLNQTKVKTEEFAAAVKEQRDAQRPKKEKRILSDREKAIEKVAEIFQRTGIAETVAYTMAATEVDKRMAEVGRKVNPS